MSNQSLKFLNGHKEVNYFYYEQMSNANNALFSSFTLFYRVTLARFEFFWNVKNLIRKSRFRDDNTVVYSIITIQM